MAKEKSTREDSVVKVAILIVLAVGSVLGYAQYITGANQKLARLAVAVVVVFLVERLLQKK